jgi:threonine dehydrogenase-like Zn-dependent dehydrogenase
MTGRGLAALACGLIAAAASVAPADGAPSRSQTFFRAQVLADNATTDEIVDLLRHGGGFVDRKITFNDLTGDGRQDAVVRVTSGGAAGIVGVYVFSTDGKKQSDALRVVFRRQALIRGKTSVSKHLLTYATRTYDAGDELCCPSSTAEYVVRWDKAAGRFRTTPATDAT